MPLLDVILTAEINDGSGFVTRKARLPIAPFPGLTIGADRVIEVLVCQGADNAEITVQLQAVSEESAMLRSRNGWRLERYDEPSRPKRKRKAKGGEQ